MVTSFCVIVFKIFCWNYYRHCCFTFASTVILMLLLLFVNVTALSLTLFSGAFDGVELFSSVCLVVNRISASWIMVDG